MSKYVSRIMDEVYDNFRNHFTEPQEQKDFLRELIEELSQEYNFIEYDNDLYTENTGDNTRYLSRILW